MPMRIVIALLGLALVGCTGAAPSPSASSTSKPVAPVTKNIVASTGKLVPAALDPRRPRPPRPSNVEIQRVPRAPRR
jgi:hypothetical protein